MVKSNSGLFWGTATNLDRLRRFLLTVFLYIAFGIGALAVSLFLILPVVLFTGNRATRVRRVRWFNQQAFNSFTQSGIILGVFEVNFVDDELLDQPGQIIIANHPSLLDVVFLLGRVSNANCVVKKKLLRNPFLATQVYFADYILNDDGETLLAQCINRLEFGESVIIFPEGTRTIKNQGYKFKRGAAYLMLNTKSPVRPVHISCNPSAMGKKDPWYYTPDRKICYQLAVKPTLNLAKIRQSKEIRLPLKSRRLTQWLMGYYRAMDSGKFGWSLDINVLPSIPKQ